MLLSYRGMLLQLERRESMPLEVELQGTDGARLQASQKSFDLPRPSIDDIDVEVEGVGSVLEKEEASSEASAIEGEWLAAERALSNPALIVFTYNRPHYLRQTLKSLTNVAGLKGVTVYVSCDGTDVQVEQTALSFGGKSGELAPPFTRGYELWQHPRRTFSPPQPGHAYVAQHYKWALDRVFHDLNHSHAILVEDDMLFAIDFLRYFEATAPLLEIDPTIWCISSWNDNG
eukprot:CAMPEP_0198208766 /NCGR_PEP_ID=MMETSP1445-20131203/12114_1 /TAXON_ID=36898 /ORGANISM="Pyramimonas sp., Strain CCMP2087" /LENGTH=230 /DNA_ID=CAMNT_0043882301 /DNA_START=163 /DNA_END=851 /DNA_ORIENTATION=+